MATAVLQVVAGVAINYGLSFLASKLTKSTKTETGKLDNVTISSAAEGEPIPRIYGTSVSNGQIIWATKFTEHTKTTTTDSSSGKGGGGGGATTTTYWYTVSFAVAFCEGDEYTTLGRIWLDNKEVNVDLTGAESFEFHSGAETQLVSSIISSVEGVENTPAFKGTCYLVFENLPLTDYGNRIPSVKAEINKPIISASDSDMCNAIKAVTLMPASGEAAYGTQAYYKEIGGYTEGLNTHTIDGTPDAVASIDDMVKRLPNLESVALIVAWFGNDLRAGHCTIRPKIEDRHELTPNVWTVSTYTKDTAELVSTDDEGNLNYGGTPSDTTVKEVIAYLKTKGLKVIFYPFVMMDITENNTLPNPYSDADTSGELTETGQSAFPWRGRITCSPAPGYAGTVDGTAEAATQISAYFTEYAAMVEHYATLCVEAGGVDGFIIASEMIGLTQVRSSLGVYPAVSNTDTGSESLRTIAATVKSIVNDTANGCLVGYACDWSEQVHSHADGFWFNLDPLWADSNIDFIGIDNYLPTSDWREGRFHEDFDSSGPITLFNTDYFNSQIEGGDYGDQGEYYAYYYANIADRDNQIRTSITDNDYNKPWIHRRKDFRNWWSNYHYNRPGWIEETGHTDWIPESKPIWFTEFGCPAVDKGTNQPNVFYDPKSSESAFPYYSNGSRDDSVPRFYIESLLSYWDNYSPTNTAVGKMIDPSNMYAWTWDARPYPYFPNYSWVWSDYANYTYGHWLNGRVTNVTLSNLVGQLCSEAGLSTNQYDTTELLGPDTIILGFCIDNVSTIRDSLEKLAAAYFFDAIESDGKIKFRLKHRVGYQDVEDEDIVVSSNDPVGLELTRTQNSEAPSNVTVSYYNFDKDYEVSTVSSITNIGNGTSTAQVDLPITMDSATALAIATAMVQQANFSKEEGIIQLPFRYIHLDSGDGFNINLDNRTIKCQATKISIGDKISVDFMSFSSYVFLLKKGTSDVVLSKDNYVYGIINLVFMNIPSFSLEEPNIGAPRIAALSDPWPGSVNVYKETGLLEYTLINTHSYKNKIGVLYYDFYSGPTGVWDDGNELWIELYYGALVSASSDVTLLNSPIAIAIENVDGECELVQFVNMEFKGSGIYKLTRLLRGQLGTNYAMRDAVAAGANIVVINNDVTPLNISDSSYSTESTYLYGPGPYNYTHDSYTTQAFTGNKAGLKPYSPCGFCIDRQADTTWLLSWKRRTRFNGDSWEQTEVPLNEEFEQYRLKVYEGETLISTHIINDAQYLSYDWSTYNTSEPSLLKIVLQQYGSDYGDYGSELTGTYYIRSAV